MELVYFETVAQSGYTREIYDLLVMADKDFIPPLSARGSTTQEDLTKSDSAAEGVRAYYDTMAQQPVILALEDDRCLGFMAFKEDYTCEHISTENLPNLYASTCAVHPDARGRGMMTGFYRKMIELYPTYPIFTRTWHTNYSHLHILEKLGFREILRLKDHRGPGMDTVYYCRRA